MKHAILSPFYPVSEKLDTSHRAGWARYWANELRHQHPKIPLELLTTKTMGRLSTYGRDDVVHLYHGMEFKGQMNLQSGLTDEILGRVKLLLDAAKRGVRFLSLDTTMPNYGRLLMARGMDETSGEALSKLCLKTAHLKAPCFNPRFLVIGDSHALSMYTPSTTIYREDGQTLHGALERGLQNIVDGQVLFEMGVEVVKLERLTFYYGNIDLRHHLMRQPSPEAATKELVQRYVSQVLQVQKTLRPKVVEMVMPLSIEDESRQIPKSGWYKGAPFAGTWHERHQLRLVFRDQLQRLAKKHGLELYHHPKHFVGKDGKLPFDVMEQPRSVHIRPSEYRLVQEGKSWLV